MLISESHLGSGYASAEYAAALAEYGTPRQLLVSDGWILERPIPNSPLRDAMGCYPLFACQSWAGLATDLEDLAGELVCISLVTDPLGQYDAALLNRCFPDIARPFKEHFVVELTVPVYEYLSGHHQRNVRRALDAVTVEPAQNAAHFGSEWVALYENLVKRHGIVGIAAFSRQSLLRQLAVPGAVALRARYSGATVGMLIWYVMGEVAYYHLGAYNDAGYELRASFALFWTAIEYFRAQGVRWLGLGAGAGVQSSGEDGLSRFKRGWATGTRTAYLCGRIFNQKAYDQLTTHGTAVATSYFPAYRFGEFA